MSTTKSEASNRPRIDKWIGFFGCTNRLVSVSWDGLLDRPSGATIRDAKILASKGLPEGYEKRRNGRPMRKELKCPACGNKHVATFQWRARREDETADIELN